MSKRGKLSSLIEHMRGLGYTTLGSGFDWDYHECPISEAAERVPAESLAMTYELEGDTAYRLDGKGERCRDRSPLEFYRRGGGR